jgi:hypothetical protein
MASLKEIMKPAVEKMREESAKEEAKESGIQEFVEKVFTTRNLVHFAHWDTKSYASHMALGDLYDEIVEATDELVETFIGEFKKVPVFETDCAKSGGDIIKQIQSDSDWLKQNRSKVAAGSTTIENLIDGVMGAYNRTLYKLET